MILLAFLFISHTLVLFEGDTRFFSQKLQANDKVKIESPFPFLCVYFLRLRGITLSIYTNDQLYKNITDSYSISGVDFGNSHGSIIFRATEDTDIVISAIVFPFFCQKHRYISSLPQLNFTFSSDSEIADYQIMSNQRFCFWPSAPTDHFIRITADTEQHFDKLLVHAPPGIIALISGNETFEFMSMKGAEFITWETDVSTISRMFSISIETEVYAKYPVIDYMISGIQASDVSLFFSQENDFHIRMKEEMNPELMDKFFFCLVFVTILLVIGTVFSIIWAKKVWKEHQEIKFDYISNTKGLDDYKYVESDEVPQPYVLDVNQCDK